MFKKLPFAFALCALYSFAAAQTLYTNTVETGNRYNPGTSQSGTPRVEFDDVLIPSSLVAGSDSIRVTKVKMGIRRVANAAASTINVYYTTVEDTAILLANAIKIPPVFIGTVNLPANGPTAVTTIISLGDSVSTLFRLKTDTGNLFTGFHTFFLGLSFSQPSQDNGVRLTSGPGANSDVIWIYSADSTVNRFATFFGGNPSATFYIQAFGYPVNRPLPVLLTEFKGERKGNLINLSWSTLSEQNNKEFELQRSADGTNFSSLAFIASKATGGTNVGQLNYSFDDVRPFVANNYYRFKQTDKDGKATMSNIVLIKAAKVATLQLSSIYPNPATSVLNVVVVTPENNRINLVVTDMTGKIIMQQVAAINSGSNYLLLNVAKLAAGSYTVKAICDDGCETAVSSFIKK